MALVVSSDYSTAMAAKTEGVTLAFKGCSLLAWRRLSAMDLSGYSSLASPEIVR